MLHIKSILLILLLCTTLFPQNAVIDLPTDFFENDFHPTKFDVSTTGKYFLDIENRQITFESNDGNIIYSGGYGTDFDAFIDPIDILTSKLGIWIVDGTENKIISFDHRLNYLQTIEFDAIYPDFCGIDDWGNIYLYSEIEQKIFRISNNRSDLEEFIDLSIYDEIGNCISYLHVSEDGSSAIIDDCINTISTFNRLGRINKIYHLSENRIRFVFKSKSNWNYITNDNKIYNLNDRDSIDLTIDQKIIDVSIKNNLLYILSTDKIWVVNAIVE